ncbi:hypothetical protein VUR80DRAFT_741 [Thermomyces stellatus]
MSGPDNSRNYRDFVSKCFTAIREITEAVSADPQHDVAGDVARRLERNQAILNEASATYVPPSGRRKKGNSTKRTVKKVAGIQQISSVQNAPGESSGSRPAKASKTGEGQSAPDAMNGVESNSSGPSSADAGTSKKKRKHTTAARTTKTTEQSPETYYLRDARRFLESYTFTRVVLDEYSFKDHEVETFVERAIASSKWLLSGTPPLTRLSFVCRAASMLNVHVARIEPALPSHLHEITEGPSAADMSASEAYRALRQLKTATFAHERHQQGLEFIKKFARRNSAVLGGFKVIEKVVFVPRDTPVIAHFIRLLQCLYAARWDVGGLSHDGNELLKPVIELGISEDPEVPRKRKAKSWLQDDSTDGRLDAAIQALLMHATLPSKNFHSTSAANTPGMTIVDSIERLMNDARLSCLRLCSTLTSQFDRLVWLVNQFPEMEFRGTSDGEDDDSEQDGQNEPIENEDDDGNGSEYEGEGVMDPTGSEGEVSGEGRGPKANEEWNANTTAAAEARLAKSREARDRKFRQASRYLDLLVDDIVRQKEDSIGGLEILNLIRTTILTGRVYNPQTEYRENRTESDWRRLMKGPGSSRLVDWYPEIEQRLSKMSDEELKLVYQDCACLLDQPLLPPNFDTLKASERRLATMTMIHAAQARRREQFANDHVEKSSGLADCPEELLTYRMKARKIGLKCLPDDTLETLRDRYNKHRRNRCPDKFWEFALGLTFRFPIKGMIRQLRGTKMEEGLEDLTWTSQSVTAGAYEKIPEAFHRYRFLQAVFLLAQDVLDGRLCDGCGRTGVPSDQIRLTVGCAHAFCEDCAKRNTATAADKLSWCRLCRDYGETRTMFQVRPAPGLFCHGCRQIEIERPSDAYILATCGHLMCRECLEHLYAHPPKKIDGSPDLPRCNIQGCNYPLLENEVRGDKLITKSGNVLLESLGPGGKLQKMIEIVSAAKANGERVLVFAPYKEQMSSVNTCLVDAGFSVARTDGKDSINALAGFQSPEKPFDVLLQLLNSPESAGSNLTIANHIIFVGPYFTREQRVWQMVVDQAIGRCVRPGQKKDVHVYHLVAENSLDVDVLEHHLKRRLDPDATGEVDLNVPASPVSEVDGAGGGGRRRLGRGSLLQPAELDILFRKMADYNDTDNLI